MSNSRYTDLPTVSSANLSDIICAVQGYTSSSSLGTSTQQTWAQVQALFLSNTILYNSGNPNGSLAGKTYQLCWDTANNILYICTTTGDASAAVWTSTSSVVDNNFYVITGASAQMSVNGTYQANSGSRVTLTLPVLADVGKIVRVTGLGAGGFSIAQNDGQQIIIGSSATTIGVSGSVSSTSQHDGIELICTVENTTWQTINGPQGVLTIV